MKFPCIDLVFCDGNSSLVLNWSQWFTSHCHTVTCHAEEISLRKDSALFVLLRMDHVEHACRNASTNELKDSVDEAVVEQSSVDDLRGRDDEGDRRVQRATRDCTN